MERATEAVHRFPDLYADAWLDVFRPKLGLGTAEAGDKDLIGGLLSKMATAGADFTNTFANLDAAPFPDWHDEWSARLTREGSSPEASAGLRTTANPAVIPRNHRVEAVVEAGVAGDFAPFHDLNRVLATPFELAEADAHYATPPEPGEEGPSGEDLAAHLAFQLERLAAMREAAAKLMARHHLTKERFECRQLRLGKVLIPPIMPPIDQFDAD